jgi:hypothetical protein
MDYVLQGVFASLIALLLYMFKKRFEAMDKEIDNVKVIHAKCTERVNKQAEVIASTEEKTKAMQENIVYIRSRVDEIFSRL